MKVKNLKHLPILQPNYGVFKKIGNCDEMALFQFDKSERQALLLLVFNNFYLFFIFCLNFFEHPLPPPPPPIAPN
jgi:hypothetical protein